MAGEGYSCNVWQWEAGVCVEQALPLSADGSVRLPRVLREATSFVMMDRNLRAKGMFRISALALTVDILKEAYDRGQKFIVWREADTVLSFPHWKQGSGNAMVDELDQTEGYGIHAATGLIKRWYRELREPIFPQSYYVQVKTIFGGSEALIDVSCISELISPTSERSFIAVTSRLILTKHLLPLLSKVAELNAWNQMTPYNLSVCFAPILLYGPDPAEDAKIASTIRCLLEAAITLAARRMRASRLSQLTTPFACRKPPPTAKTISKKRCNGLKHRLNEPVPLSSTTTSATQIPTMKT